MSAPSVVEGQQSLGSNRAQGDTTKMVQQHYEEILDSQSVLSENEYDALAGLDDHQQLQYVNDSLEVEKQVLAPARDEAIAKLDELSIAIEEANIGEAKLQKEDNYKSLENPIPDGHGHASTVPANNTTKNGIEDAISHQEIQRSGLETHHTEAERLHDGEPMDESLDDPLEIAEVQLLQWQNSNMNSASALDIWRMYESVTSDLAYSLCESLRLILEPTRATRLRGDYRTGRRLNMKKIIPYIASEYTKDKIWLRRTRPSQREYQILLALDDSKSMAESHSIHLAYQTLAIVTKALSRLEAGDIAVAKFGQTVEMVHEFGSGAFTDGHGSQIASAFHFDQKATNVLSLMQTSLKVLKQARQQTMSSSSQDLWQLEIIISDGMCQDHDALRAVLRKADEQRIMIVFIILDSLHANVSSRHSSSNLNQNSILSFQTASYKNIDGQMQVHTERYLDSFPFEYFVVLRNVEALPEVLSSTLRQFFERIAEE